MTDNDKAAALAWLDDWCHEKTGISGNAARTIKSMLAEPRMPEEPSGLHITAMFHAAHQRNCGLSPDGMADAYRALREHLSKPATRTVQVWLVHYAARSTDGGKWEPRTRDFETQEGAEAHAAFLRQGTYAAHVRVTGPYDQELPA